MYMAISHQTENSSDVTEATGTYKLWREPKLCLLQVILNQSWCAGNQCALQSQICSINHYLFSSSLHIHITQAHFLLSELQVTATIEIATMAGKVTNNL